MPVNQSVSQPARRSSSISRSGYASEICILAMYSMYYYFGRFDPPRVFLKCGCLSCPVLSRYFPSLTRRRALDPRMPHPSCSLRCTGTRLIQCILGLRVLCIFYIYLSTRAVLCTLSLLSLNSSNYAVLSAHTLSLTCHLTGGSVKSRLSGGVDPEDSVPHG